MNSIYYKVNYLKIYFEYTIQVILFLCCVIIKEIN